MINFASFQFEEVTGFKFNYDNHIVKNPKMFAHFYFVDGLLIDTGQRKAQHKIMEETQKLEIQQIYVTHHHEDHSGNIAAIRDHHDCPVYASKLCCEMMKHPPKITFAQKLAWGDRESQQDLIPKSGTISTPQFQFEIIPIPGHAPDMIALYEPHQKWLFSSDLYLNSYIDYFITTESMAQQIDSIKRILELDFKVMFCAHKPQLKNAKQQLTKKLHFLETFFEKVAEQYAQGYSAKVIFKRLQLKENWTMKLLSQGYLSKLNMVRSVIRDLEYANPPITKQG